MIDRPRILLISSIFPNSAEPTKGVYISNIAENLGTYCNVKVVAPIPYFPKWLKSKKYGFVAQIAAHEKIKGLDVYHPRVIIPPKIGRSLYGLLYAGFLLDPVKKLIRSFNPDLILCYWIYPDGFAAAFLSQHFRLPLILGGRGCDVNEQTRPFTKRFLLRWAIDRSKLVLSVSQAMKKNLLQLGIPTSKIRVIPNGISKNFKPTTLFHREPTTILYCGRLSNEKGIQYLIEAAKLLLLKNVPYRIVLVGDGPLRPMLSKMIFAYGLSDKIEIKGEVSHDLIPRFMEQSSLLCLPSLREGWPNVAMEALACGCPVVGSNVGGLPEILSKSGLGILVPCKDPEALAAALQEGLKRNWDRKLISEHIRSRTWDRVAQEVYREIDLIIKHPENIKNFDIVENA